MQLDATRVGPRREASVRTIAVLFSSGATISSEKMIKGSILSVIVRPPTKDSHVLIAKNGPTAECAIQS
jgi:hypothetical protein